MLMDEKEIKTIDKALRWVLENPDGCWDADGLLEVGKVVYKIKMAEKAARNN